MAIFYIHRYHLAIILLVAFNKLVFRKIFLLFILYAGDRLVKFQSKNLPGCALVATQRFLRGELVSRGMRIHRRSVCSLRRR